ncbi:hypothetical protein G3I40_19205, partial [Streptomyces sp. SID14478]|uniref:hypothetical protein n=1 Tax=Streptomyces sp. SID14478 TaxID=2706073 RepID=UPI001410E3E7
MQGQRMRRVRRAAGLVLAVLCPLLPALLLLGPAPLSSAAAPFSYAAEPSPHGSLAGSRAG